MGGERVCVFRKHKRILNLLENYKHVNTVTSHSVLMVPESLCVGQCYSRRLSQWHKEGGETGTAGLGTDWGRCRIK